MDSYNELGSANGGTLVFVYCDGCQDREKYLQIKVAFGDHIAKTTFDPEKVIPLRNMTCH